jgi:hypothetical protein
VPNSSSLPPVSLRPSERLLVGSAGG